MKATKVLFIPILWISLTMLPANQNLQVKHPAFAPAKHLAPVADEHPYAKSNTEIVIQALKLRNHSSKAA